MDGPRTAHDLFVEACAFATILALFFAIGFGIYYVILGAIVNDWKVRKRTTQLLIGIWLLLSGSNLVRSVGLLGLVVPGVGLYLINKSVKKNNKKHGKPQLVIRCPHCGRSLKGATQEMIGDISICPKCKVEFTKDILSEIEYTKERSAEELFEWFKEKNEQFSEWAKQLREKKHEQFNKGLPCKFISELIPFAYFAKKYYSNIPSVKFRPCCHSEPYDGIILDKDKELLVEFATAIDGPKWALIKELLIEYGISPWEHNICGVKDNKTRRNRTVSDIITSDELTNCKDTICKTKELVKKTVFNKCKKSLEQKLPYGQGKTILIVTFDDTVFFGEKRRDDLIDFKKTEIDSMEHNFRKIILFGQPSNEFID